MDTLRVLVLIASLCLFLVLWLLIYDRLIQPSILRLARKLLTIRTRAHAIAWSLCLAVGVVELLLASTVQVGDHPIGLWIIGAILAVCIVFILVAAAIGILIMIWDAIRAIGNPLRIINKGRAWLVSPLEI